MVKMEIVKIDGAPLSFLACHFLLNDLGDFSDFANKPLATHLLMAARILLAKCWKQADMPTKVCES